MKLEERFLHGADEIRKLAMQTLFERLDSLCEGAIAVDQQARVVWMNEKHAKKLGLKSVEAALGCDDLPRDRTELARRFKAIFPASMGIVSAIP